MAFSLEARRAVGPCPWSPRFPSGNAPLTDRRRAFRGGKLRKGKTSSTGHQSLYMTTGERCFVPPQWTNGSRRGDAYGRRRLQVEGVGQIVGNRSREMLERHLPASVALGQRAGFLAELIHRTTLIFKNNKQFSIVEIRWLHWAYGQAVVTVKILYTHGLV